MCLDNDLNVVYWSDAAERIFGWQREEFLGRSILIRLPSELHDYVSQTMRAIREGAPHLPSEFEDYRKNGSRVWVSRLLERSPERRLRALRSAGRFAGIRREPVAPACAHFSLLDRAAHPAAGEFAVEIRGFCLPRRLPGETLEGGTRRMVTPLKFVGDERALAQALRARHPGAVAAFYDQHAAHVHRTLRAALGADADLPDLLQEVFIRAVDGINALDDLARVRSWLTTIAVFTARAHIRRRARRHWLGLFSPQRVELGEQDPPCSDARFALREVYQLLDQMPLNERMAFALRIIDGMTLPDAAEASSVSLATFKRRLSRAEKAFVEAARHRPKLVDWLQGGTRWNLQKQG